MGALASLSLNLAVDTSAWSKGLKKAEDAVGGFAGSVASKTGGIAKSMAGLGKGAAAGLGAIGPALAGVAGGLAVFEAARAGLSAAFEATVGAVAGGIERIDQLTDAAGRIGVTTEALSTLRYAADLTGSSAEDLDGALEKLNANLGDAAMKGTPAGEALARLGLDAKALAGVPADQAFRKIVAGFENVPNAADKASIAMDIFGKGGLKILNTLGAGSGEIDRLAQEAARFGVAVGQVDAAKIGAAKDSIDRAGAAVQGLGNAAAVALAPAIEVAATLMTDFMTDTIAQAGGVEGAIAGVVTAFGWIADAAHTAQKFTQEMLAGAMDLAGGVMSAVGISAGKGMEQAARTMMEDVQRNFDVMPSDKLAAFLADVKSKANSAAQASADLAKANQGAAAGAGMDGIGKGVADLTEKLKEQAATFGMTAAEADIYKLATKGATEEQLAGARAIAGQIKELEKTKKDRDDRESKAKKDKDDLENKAKDYIKDTRTPEEKVAFESAEIDKVRDAGLLTDDQASRAKAKSRKDAGLDETKFAGAEDARSSGGYSTIVAALSGRGTGMSELVKTNRETLKANNSQVSILGKIFTKLTGSQDAEVVNI